MISVDAYPFLAFSELTCHSENTKMFSGCTVLPDTKEVAMKRLFHQQVKYRGSFSAMFALASASLQLFPVVWVFLGSLGVICYNR